MCFYFQLLKSHMVERAPEDNWAGDLGSSDHSLHYLICACFLLALRRAVLFHGMFAGLSFHPLFHMIPEFLMTCQLIFFLFFFFEELNVAYSDSGYFSLMLLGSPQG